MPDNDELAIIVDTETAGFKIASPLLEVAWCFVRVNRTTRTLNFSQIAHALEVFTPERLAQIKLECDPVVLAMHAKSGLWDRLADVNQDSLLLDDTLRAAWRPMYSIKSEKLYVIGRNPSFDIGFLEAYTPKAAECLSYRKVDTVGIQWLFKDICDPVEHRLHTAMADVADVCLALETYFHAVWSIR